VGIRAKIQIGGRHKVCNALQLSCGSYEVYCISNCMLAGEVPPLSMRRVMGSGMRITN